jgi:hypothetical protein
LPEYYLDVTLSGQIDLIINGYVTNTKLYIMTKMKLLTVDKTLSRIARAWSLISIGFILLSLVGEVLSPHSQPPNTAEMVGLAFFPVGVLIGLAIGWWSEGLGGAIATASLASFYLWSYTFRCRLAGGPFFLAVAAPGIIFLVNWAFKRQLDKASDESRTAT